ncbi:Voltage-gated chloride channel (ClcA) [Rasamsonia emersonii CBS 393.64]|uniref:Voltage-gated chloride channel (ClcA) n=1 Tax=Rasamsonia emersonii (strain ATCC 16479 / CBS 393.64 / IMI 116815) TaxID=1408163 RepID=A0A0F4YST9_RASE3|nr:Voltage-gated chloride channel (ClcA) [Rasamsonia emersonii CBS 393.64]KKA21150.1 Voltage-gated chloride channel (ClcA) [Rasamsonia emersonii CBS 393.64]
MTEYKHPGRSLRRRPMVDEALPMKGRVLLGTSSRNQVRRSYTGISFTSRPDAVRYNASSGTLRRPRHHSRKNSQNTRFGPDGNSHPSGPGADDAAAKDGMMASSFLDERLWYDQFTSIDWVHDSIADGIRLRKLRSRKDLRGRLLALFDSVQGWILVAVIGCITAAIAYFVDVTENTIYDLKDGFCTTTWFASRKSCCRSEVTCDAWRSWSQILGPSSVDHESVDFALYVVWAVVLAAAACALTLFTKTVVPSTISLSTLDENLGAELGAGNSSPSGFFSTLRSRPAMVYYSAAGSGVAEVKVILSGFVLHGYLGLKTLVFKTLALILAISSGLSLGKEGPYVHIGSCVGNICCRIFAKYRNNDGKRREVLSASASSGVAVAFGAPIGGVLFGLEEVRYLLLSSQNAFQDLLLLHCCRVVIEIPQPIWNRQNRSFRGPLPIRLGDFEMMVFVLLGVLGGVAGALFIKAAGLWARSFRRIPIIKKWPMLEVVLVALVTGLVSYWNRYTKLAVSELLSELATPCNRTSESETGLCPDKDGIMEVVRYLLAAFLIKSILTIITFGIKVPAGIYVPSMVVGGLMGRIVGHITQYFVVTYPDFFLFASCPATPGMESCVTPGVYAMIAAGATMCGVTRLSVTLAVILFELTGSLNHVLPFCIAVLCAKWTADAIEPRSIYDLLIDMNSYPFLDNKTHPICDAELGDLVPPVRKHRIIDISNSPLVPARELREKLDYLLMAGELDSGLPIVRDNILVGLIPAPDLEFALDKLEDEDNELCIMSVDRSYTDIQEGNDDNRASWRDFTPYIDPAPVALDIHSPIDLVYQCFMKLGLRYICVLRDGKFVGLVHKKLFVKFMKENEEI